MEEKEKKKLLDKDDEKEILKCWANIVAKRAKEVGKELDRIGDSFQDYGARDSFQKELSRQKISDEKDLSVFADFICDRTWCASGMILKVGDFTHISIGACSAILFSDTSVMDYLFSLSRNNIDWQEIVNKILDQLEIILTFAKKIRRNILYPEVAEMELKITRLESENLHARESLERSYKHTKELLGEADKREDDLKSQLAEKEKLNEYIQKINAVLQNIDIGTHEIATDIQSYFPDFKTLPNDIKDIIIRIRDVGESRKQRGKELQKLRIQFAEKEKEIEGKEKEVFDDEKELKQWAKEITTKEKEIITELKRKSFETLKLKNDFFLQLDRKTYEETDKNLCVIIFTNLSEERIWFSFGIKTPPCGTSYFYNAEGFLLQKGICWRSSAQIILSLLDRILPETEKIRRNLLYSEVAEMKKELTALKIEYDELEKEHSDRAVYLAEKEKEIEELKTENEKSKKYLWGIKNVLMNVDKPENDSIQFWFPNSSDYPNELKHILDLSQGISTQLAEKEKKIEELRKKLRELQHWYEESKKYNNALIDAIEKAVIAIWNTKSIFGKFSSKSGTLARIREDLMKVLPVEIFFKLCRFMPYKNLPPTGPPNPRPKPPEDWRVKIGAEPKEKRPNPDIKPPTYDVVSEGYDPEAVKK